MSALHCPAAVTLRAANLKGPVLSGIYFIQQGEAGPIKIGWSKNVRSRLASLQTANPQRLRLLLVLEGEERDERRLHDWFGLERLGGEWFKSDGEVATFVASQKAAQKHVEAEHSCRMSGSVVSTDEDDGMPRWGACWGTIEYYSDGDWLCEGHFHLAQYGSYLHKVHSRPGVEECRMHGSSDPCWGELRSSGPRGLTYCEAHDPVDGVYHRHLEMGAQHARSQEHSWRQHERERVDTLLASLGGDL